jgi:hypothetical protein
VTITVRGVGVVVGAFVAVGGTGVFVGTGVSVCGTGVFVAVGGTAVFVGTSAFVGVLVGVLVAVFVGVLVAVLVGVLVTVAVLVGVGVGEVSMMSTGAFAPDSLLATLLPLLLADVRAKLTRPLPVTSAVTSKDVTVPETTAPELIEVKVMAGALL